jgi:hypothetical protein
MSGISGFVGDTPEDSIAASMIKKDLEKKGSMGRAYRVARKKKGFSKMY